ncbi:MAG: M16 family metallopeptidase [Pyrinomonadaceae bacterium]
MKRSIIALLIALSIANSSLAQTSRPASSTARSNAAAAAKPAPARQSIEIPFVNKVLPNGLEVIVLSDKSVPLVTVELAVRNGSFTEPPELNGLSHLFEHMFFKTNKASLVIPCSTGNINPVYSDHCDEVNKTRPQIGDTSFLEDLGKLGIVYNGSTREEVVNYYYTTTTPYLETAMRVINASVRFPLFDEQEFENEKQVVIGEIDRNESNPGYYLNLALHNRLFYKYPTRKNPLGTRESVASATTDKMRLIQSRYYVPNNSALVVTGDVKADEVFALAERIMGSWERRRVDPFKEFPLVEHPPLAKSSGEIIEKRMGGDDDASGGTEQNVYIQIGWHGPSIGKDDAATYAADVFSYILTQPDSRFQRNLVDSGLATGVAINYYTQRNVGPITVLLVTTPAKARAALKALYGEIAQFASPGYYTADELEASKTILSARDLFDREETSEYTHTLGFWWSSTGIEYFRGYHKNLDAVTRADIDRYVKTYIIGKPRVGVALLAPEAQAAAKLTEADLVGGK